MDYQEFQQGGSNPNMTPKHFTPNFVMVVVGLLVLGGVAYGGIWFWSERDLLVACSADARLCPDGSAVGRTGPNCEFATCPRETDTSTWKTYTNAQYGFEFKYPENLKLTETSSKTNLNHSVPYKNSGECDMRGDGTTYDDLTDFNLSFEVITKINLPFKDGEYGNGELKGEWVLDGAEGCGTSSYYFPYGSKTLVIKRDNVQILSGIRNNAEEMKEILSIPGAISRERNQILFDQILATFKFIEPVVCIQVITPAKNLQTGEIREFPTPCDVPEGWLRLGLD